MRSVTMPRSSRARAAPQTPAADLDGNPRIADGHQDGDARVDIGAYEYEYANQQPVARAGTDQTATADGSCRAIVALDGGASSDADGDPLTFTWTGPFGTLSGATAPCHCQPARTRSH